LTSTGIAHALRLSDRELYSLARKGHGARNDHGLRGSQKEARESWIRISLAENELLVVEMFGTRGARIGGSQMMRPCRKYWN
jgi:hypothetical protein